MPGVVHSGVLSCAVFVPGAVLDHVRRFGHVTSVTFAGDRRATAAPAEDWE